MNVERMREDIYRYCQGRWCKNCVFGDKKSRDKKSGDGTRFLRKDIVDDEEIKKIHKIIFSEKHDLQNYKKVSLNNDLISRKSVIDILESIMLNDSNLSKRYMAAEIRDKVNKIQTDNDGWIPVEERLPDIEYDTVLCVTDMNHYFVGVYNQKYGFRTWDIEAVGKVIAWRPIPKPYKRDGK